MNIHPVLLFCFLSAVLQDGNIGLVNAEIPIFRETEGQSITVQCNFTMTGDRRFFCKHKSEKGFSPEWYNDCDREEHILEMKDDSAQRGRYSMRYETTNTGSRLNVTITQLNKSDSGRYGCGLNTSFSIDPFQKFEITVTDAPSTSTPKFTLRHSLTSASASTTTQSFRRRSTPSTFSAQTTNQSEQKQTEKTTSGSSGSWYLYLVVSVIVVVVLLAVFLPLLYKWKKRRSSNHLNSRGSVTDTNMESVIYDNCAPVSTLEESDYENNQSSIYETLNPTTMAHDQTYSTLEQPI